MNSGETLEKSIGKKAEKEKLKKRKNCNDVVSIFSFKLNEIKEEKRRMHEEKKESMRIALKERKRVNAHCIRRTKRVDSYQGREE